MDYFTKELIAALDKIRAELASLLHAIEDHKNAIRKNVEPEEKSQYEPHSVDASISANKAIPIKAETNERKDAAFWIFKGIELVGIAGVVVYAFLTYFTWCEMQKATKATRDAVDVAREAGRPWIGPMGAKPVRTASGFSVTIEFKNGGVRPARIINSKSSGHIYNVFPDNPDYGQDAIKQSRQIMVGNKPGFFQFDIAVSDAQMKQLQAGIRTLYFYGIVNYEDVSGNSKHVTKMCWFYIPSSKDTGSCAEYNDAD